MSLAQMFYAKQAFRSAMRWARAWRQQRRSSAHHRHTARPFRLEALEPRLLLSGSPLAPEELTLGTAKNGAITVPGEQDRYTFTVPQPGLVVVDALAASPTSSSFNNYITWFLTGPAGNQIASSGFGFNSSDLMNLAAGDYLFTVDGTGDAVGTYSFRIQDVTHGTATPLTLGTAVSGATLNPASERDLYEFTAAP